MDTTILAVFAAAIFQFRSEALLQVCIVVDLFLFRIVVAYDTFYFSAPAILK